MLPRCRPCLTWAWRAPLRDGASGSECSQRRVDIRPESLPRRSASRRARRSPRSSDLVARASAGRRSATVMLRMAAEDRSVDAGARATRRRRYVGPGPSWRPTSPCPQLVEALRATDEERLASDPGRRSSHPQYLWRDVVIEAARGPFLGYAELAPPPGRATEALGVLSRWYEAVRGARTPHEGAVRRQLRPRLWPGPRGAPGRGDAVPAGRVHVTTTAPRWVC